MATLNSAVDTRTAKAMKRAGRRALIVALLVGGSARAGAASIARVWNERALASIRVDTPHPPAQARNLFSLSVCMYDAWAAYDTNSSVGYVYRDKHPAVDVAAARREAISYAAYRILRERHVFSKTATTTLAADDAQMEALGYSTSNQSRDTSTPAGVGNTIYDQVSAWFINDGARQTEGTPTSPYPDYPLSQGGYFYLNPPLAVAIAGIDDGTGRTVVDVNQWQRLQIVNGFDQNGFPTGPVQPYLGAQWLGVRPFALTRVDATKPWIDPGPPPYFYENDSKASAAFRSNVVEVIRHSSELTPDDGVTMDISPGSFGNNSLGTNDGHGHALNPATGLPYEPNVVKRGDFVRVLAEFWADGPNSETPPGHWNTLANAVADHGATVKRIGGTGPVVPDLEWDVKCYFSLNAALHDAACSAWSLKRYYLGWRPITAVRYLAGLGQSSDPSLPHYHKNGLPLIPNIIELVTPATIASGRHAGLTVGQIALLTWPGEPGDPANQYQGVKWKHGISWVPYQRKNFVTPAFPGYTSGHSSFSRSAAELLAAFTGSEYFPGGMATYTSPANTGLAFEKGPSTDIQLQWATYFDAADQAGLSRIWGGIHPPIDDFGGRVAGAQCGRQTWALARKYWNGEVASTSPNLAIRQLKNGAQELRFETLRGLYCKLQSAPELNAAFADDGGGFTQVMETLWVRTNTPTEGDRFYRAVIATKPAP